LDAVAGNGHSIDMGPALGTCSGGLYGFETLIRDTETGCSAQVVQAPVAVIAGYT